MSEISAKPEKETIDYSMQIKTPEGVITLEELVNKKVQERLEKIRKRAPSGKRRLAIKKFCEILYQRGSVAEKMSELREIAQEVRKDVGIRFSHWLLLKNKFVLPVTKEVQDKISGRKFKVRLYVLSPKKYEDFFGEKLAPTPVTETTQEATEQAEAGTEEVEEAEETPEETEEIEAEIEKQITE